MTLSEKTILALKAAALDARKPANHLGKCKAPYIVVQDGGTKPVGKTTCVRVVALYAYVPHNQPAKMPELLSSIRAAMATVPALTLAQTGEETTNEEFEALATSMTYMALCAR